MPSNPLQVLWTRKSSSSPVQSSLASSSSVSESPRFGLKKLTDGVDPTFDIVAVHGSLGLGDKGEKSWTAKNGVNWLGDLLPSDVPQARIFSWGYDARSHRTSAIKSQTLYDHARNLVSDLCQERRVTDTRRRPIIFVAHSFGGIVVKSALIHSNVARAGALQDHHSIKLSTYGIIFMGTPHQGSEGVDLQKLALRAAKVIESTDTGILKHLKGDPGWLRQLDGQYEPIHGEFVTIFAYETAPTLGKTTIIPKSSAILPGFSDTEAIAIPADHVTMVKFSSLEDKVYQKLSRHLSVLGREAPGRINERWEQHENSLREIAEMEFSLPFSISGVPEAQTFVGREEELTNMREALRGDGSQRKVVVLQGLGGIGKTQLAVKFLKDVADSYSAVLWLDGKTEDTLKQSFALTAKRLYKYHPASKVLKRAAESKDIDDAVVAVRDWLSANRNHRWLLVFDNVDNPVLSDVEDLQAYDVQSYFPEANQGSIIITTRSSRLNIGDIVPVTKLGTEESVKILHSTSRREGLDQDPHVQDLVDELDGLPLALVTTGAYLRQASTRLDVYLRNYRASWPKLQTKSPRLMSYRDRTLYTTWNISLTHIEMQSKSAGQLLRLLGYFDNHDIWYKLLAAGSKAGPGWFSEIVKDEINFNEVSRVLSDHALVEAIKGSDGFTMHPCVHAWIMHVLNAEKDTLMTRTAVCCIGFTVPDLDTPQSWEVERRLLPHALGSLEFVCSSIHIGTQNDTIFLGALQGLGSLYLHQGKMAESETVYQLALEGYEKVLGPEHTSTFNTLNNLANLYSDQGKTVEAEAMYQRALEGKEKALGPDHPSTLGTVGNLAGLLRDMGKMVEAEAFYQRALEGYEKTLGPEHISTLNTVDSFATFYRDQDKMVEAETMYQRALVGSEKLLGPEHPSTLSTVNKIAVLYSDQGKMVEAEVMYRRALEGQEKVLGPEHISTLSTINNLGTLYSERGSMVEAEVMYQRALDGYEKALGPEHVSTLDTVNNLGSLYSDQDKMEEAEALYHRALDGYEKGLNPEPVSTLRTVHNLGALYRKQNKWVEAEAMFHRALEGYEKVLGPQHTTTLTTISNIGILYMDQGKMVEAEKMYQHALEGLEKVLGPEHLSTLDTVNNLATLHSDQGNMVEAEAMYQRTLDGRQKALGPMHRLTLDTVQSLAMISALRGKMVEAEAMYKCALEGREKVLGRKHRVTLETVASLAMIYQKRGNMTEAEAMYRRALEGFEKALGPEHEYTLDTAHSLAIFCENQGNIVEAEMLYQRALKGYKNVWGLKHISTLETFHDLGLAYQAQGKKKEAAILLGIALNRCEKTVGLHHQSALVTASCLRDLYLEEGKMEEAELISHRYLTMQT